MIMIPLTQDPTPRLSWEVSQLIDRPIDRLIDSTSDCSTGGPVDELAVWSVRGEGYLRDHKVSVVHCIKVEICLQQGRLREAEGSPHSQQSE